jgi:phosphoglycolate phosphatase-like HAD superfamily hydrolase
VSARTLLFLDFDGVICDSATECLATSLSAYAVLHPGRSRGDDDRDARVREKFFELRPYVRNGEDYLFMREMIDLGIEIKSQVDFDDYIARSPAGLAGKYREAFYDARSKSFAEDPGKWLSANPIYPHMAGPLREHGFRPGLFILSTKRTKFIEAILSHNGIKLSTDRILESGEGERKVDRISRVLDEGGAGRAVFVDDQVEHLVANEDARIETCLPIWGYIEKSCFDFGDGIRVINERDMAELFGLLDS